MTKRAGKRKNRMGKGPLKPPPGPEGPIVRDPVESLTTDTALDLIAALRIELRALKANWLIGTDQADAMRQGLLNKILRLSIDERIAGDPAKNVPPNPEILLKIFQVLSIVEQRQQRLDLQRIASLIRLLQPKQAGGSLDGISLTVTNSATAVVQSSPESPVSKFDLVQQLLGDNDISKALMAGTN